jgi:hypothetical protein
MPWEIEVTDEYLDWYRSLDRAQREDVDQRIELLEAKGPDLRRPYVERIRQSKLSNLKELRCSSDGCLRTLFVFDPRRVCIILVGGDKTGRWNEWYDENVPRAEAIYEQYLKELREEGLL